MALDPNHRKLLIIGAGPHGLTIALRAVDAGLRCGVDFEVIDPSGDWLTAWKERFAAHRIDRLRSPGVHHPGPEPGALSRFADDRGERNTATHGQPLTSAFNGFCDHLVAEAGLADAVTEARVHMLAASADLVTALCGGDRVVTAERAVLAVNAGRRRIPTWVHDLLPIPVERVAHADDVDLRGLDLAGETITVVGGGLTAAHLALGALECGAEHVNLVMRRRLRRSAFDVEPGWLGPKYLQGFARMAIADRPEAIRAARDGGSVTPSAAAALDRAEGEGRLRLIEDARVVAGSGRGGRPTIVLGDETHVRADRLWLATGSDCTVEDCRLLEDVAASHPCPIHGGLPELCDDLSWPGTPLHLLGRLAGVRLGPASGNIWGALRAAERIAPALAAAVHPAGSGRVRRVAASPVSPR